MGMLGQINERLNKQLQAKGKEPFLDTNPRGVSPSDINELKDAEVPEVDMEVAHPALPLPPNVPKGVVPIDVLSSIVDDHVVEELPSVPPPPKEEAVNSAEKESIKPRPLKKLAHKQEKSVARRTPSSKVITKVIATDISLDMHAKMEAFIKAHPDKATNKKQLVRYFIMRGLKNAKF